MNDNKDSYGSTIRAAMKRAMGKSAGEDKFRPLNRRHTDKYSDDILLYLLCLAGLLAASILIMGLDRVMELWR